MSRRIVTKTKIQNKELAREALQTLGWSCQEEGNTLRITSGGLRQSVLNFTTGEVTGDSDYHSDKAVGDLRKHYAEAAYMQQVRLEGHLVESREILPNGQIRVVYSGNFAS